MLDPDKLKNEDIRLHLGELTPEQCRTARAAIRWANSVREEAVAALLAERDAALAKLGEIKAACDRYDDIAWSAYHKAVAKEITDIIVRREEKA